MDAAALQWGIKNNKEKKETPGEWGCPFYDAVLGSADPES